MTYKILVVIIYLFSFAISFIGMCSVQFDKFCNVKKPVQVQTLCFTLSIALAYLVGQFFLQFLGM